jgi:hypothetical protein
MIHTFRKSIEPCALIGGAESTNILRALVVRV